MTWTCKIARERPAELIVWWEDFYEEDWDATRLLAEAIEIWLLTVDVTLT